MTTRVTLGFDKATGAAVAEPIGHLAVFGQTRRAGKTTTLRTLVGELAGQSLTFRTGRGEIPFPLAETSTPFFRERVDWRGVEAMLWSFLQEKPKVYRPIIMRAVHGAHSLEEVHLGIVSAGKKSKNGWVVDRTYELDQYFQEILPWLREHRLASEVRLGRRASVVDLEGWPETVQQLVIAATLEKLMEGRRRDEPLVVLLPEARTFLPSDRATPVKLAADRFARMGAKLNLFLWVDSQALTGVDQQILRNFALLLQGVQTSDLELKRISQSIEGVKPAMVRALRVGDFLLSTQDGVRTIHVPLTEPKEENVEQKERDEYEKKIGQLEDAREEDRLRYRALELELKGLKQQLASKSRPGPVVPLVPAHSPAVPSPDDGAGELLDLKVKRDVREILVTERVVVINATEDDLQGKVALLIRDGFFSEPRKVGTVATELFQRNWGYYLKGGKYTTLQRALRTLGAWGIFREDTGQFLLTPNAQSRIRTKKED